MITNHHQPIAPVRKEKRLRVSLVKRGSEVGELVIRDSNIEYDSKKSSPTLITNLLHHQPDRHADVCTYPTKHNMEAAMFETASIFAAPRTFVSVKHALAWYCEIRASRMGRAINLESMRTPRSQADIDSSQATYARIAECLTEKHEADRDDEPLPERHVTRLLCWMFSGWTQESQAEEADVTLHALQTWMRATERRLRGRFEARGLLREDT